MSETSPTNPYESPRDFAPPTLGFTEGKADELMDLRQRVTELERRVSRSWIVHPNFLLRVFAVVGYWLVGYAIIAAIGAVIAALVEWVFRR